MKLIAKRFRVLNYRNIDDSGWIPLERATVFVGRNEAGKTALLKALHKFNPAIKEPYIAQREFPRDRFTGEYQDAKDWPVCRVEFELSDEFRKELGDVLNDAAETPQKVILTRSYKGNLKIEYDTEVLEDLVDPGELTEALDVFAKGARRLAAPSEDQEEATRLLRTKLVNWAGRKKGAIGKLRDLRSLKGTGLLGKVRREANTHAQPETADLVEVFHKKADELLGRAKTLPISQRLDEAIENALPVFIYFMDSRALGHAYPHHLAALFEGTLTVDVSVTDSSIVDVYRREDRRHLPERNRILSAIVVLRLRTKAGPVVRLDTESGDPYVIADLVVYHNPHAEHPVSTDAFASFGFSQYVIGAAKPPAVHVASWPLNYCF